MDHPKVVVNVRFEDRNNPTARQVDEQFEFQLVGSHIKVRPLVNLDSDDEEDFHIRKNKSRDRSQEEKSTRKVYKSPDGIGSERFDLARDTKRDKSNHSNCRNCSRSGRDRSMKTGTSRENSRKRLDDQASEESSKRGKHPRHISRREEYENEKKLQSETLEDISNWSIMMENEIGAKSNKGRYRRNRECGKIHYCLEEDEDDFEQLKSQNLVLSEHCDVDCYFEDENEASADQTEHKGKVNTDCKKKYRQRTRSPSKKTNNTNLYNSVDEMLEDSAKQFYDKGHRLEEFHDNRQEGKNKYHRSRSHTPRQKLEESQNYENERRLHHKKRDKDQVEIKEVNYSTKRGHTERRASSNSSASVEEVNYSTKRGHTERRASSNSSASVEELLNRLADRLYERRLQLKVILAFKRLLEHKRIRESISKGYIENRNIPKTAQQSYQSHSRKVHHYHSKHEKEDRGHTMEDISLRRDTFFLKESSLPPKVACTVRCCSKQKRLEEFYKAQANEQLKPQPDGHKIPEEKPTKEKSTSSLYDLGLRTNEDKRP